MTAVNMLIHSYLTNILEESRTIPCSLAIFFGLMAENISHEISSSVTEQQQLQYTYAIFLPKNGRGEKN